MSKNTFTFNSTRWEIWWAICQSNFHANLFKSRPCGWPVWFWVHSEASARISIAGRGGKRRNWPVDPPCVEWFRKNPAPSSWPSFRCLAEVSPGCLQKNPFFISWKKKGKKRTFRAEDWWRFTWLQVDRVPLNDDIRQHLTQEDVDIFGQTTRWTTGRQPEQQALVRPTP